jgi:hydroxymethylpyrimidine/phosphomethylpyrimidine kinase
MNPAPSSAPSPVPPVALTIAGSDCSAGAGLQADLKTFQHFGVHGLSAVTCVVSETANIVRAVHPVPVDVTINQASLLLDSFPVTAVKTGMLFSTAHVLETAALLQRARPAFLVVDPVMIASTGDPLLQPEAIRAYMDRLLPLATLATPNIPEAETLLERKIPDESTMERAAADLARRFGISILLKGGHFTGDSADDLLYHQGSAFWFRSPRITAAASHGTGCTLSAAITACLAHGYDLLSAVAAAKHYLNHTLSTSYTFPSSTPIHALNQGTLPFSR